MSWHFYVFSWPLDCIYSQGATNPRTGWRPGGRDCQRWDKRRFSRHEASVGIWKEETCWVRVFFKADTLFQTSWKDLYVLSHLSCIQRQSVHLPWNAGHCICFWVSSASDPCISIWVASASAFELHPKTVRRRRCISSGLLRLASFVPPLEYCTVSGSSHTPHFHTLKQYFRLCIFPTNICTSNTTTHVILHITNLLESSTQCKVPHTSKRFPNPIPSHPTHPIHPIPSFCATQICCTKSNGHQKPALRLTKAVDWLKNSEN